MRAPSSMRLHLACSGLVILCVLAAAQAFAAPLVGRTVPIRQPDGTLVDVVVWGDEFYAVGETHDGFTLTRDPETGFHCYAKLSDDGRSLVSTGVPAREAPPVGLARHVRIASEAARERALTVRADFDRRAHEGPGAPPARAGRGPTVGQARGVCLLVDFSDDPGTIPPGTVYSFCNQPGFTGYGNNGSVYDYFYDVSDGALDYTNYVPTAYYRASHTKAYYCDARYEMGYRARDLIHEALSALNASGFDFTQCDGDGDGTIDAVNCFYAGEVWNEWGYGLWPHSWTVTYCADGVCTSGYQISNMSTSLGLGVFCHENGHLLMGWPDLYDYDFDSSGDGDYCLMAYGGFWENPVEPCAYLKIAADWAEPIVVTDSAEDIPVPLGNVIFKFPHPTQGGEYYLIENRQQTDRDAWLPDAGLAIWHIALGGSNNYQAMTPSRHYLVTLVQADGNWDLEHYVNYGDAYDLYSAPYDVACTPETYPNTNWWDGSGSGLAFTGISASGPTMTFDYTDAPPPSPGGFAADGEELCAILRWRGVNTADLDYYLVERDTTVLFGSGAVAIQTPDTTHVAYPLEPGTEYFFRVSSVDVTGHVSLPTATLSAVPTPDAPPPTATGLTALGGGGVVELRWDTDVIPDITGYHVVRDSTVAFATPETLGFPAGGPYIDATCPLNNARWYRLVAEDHGGVLGGPTAPVAGIAVPGRAWYVDASYGGSEYGSYLQPYRTIAPALDRAVSGDAIVVWPGVYAEAVDLRNGVSMVGMRGAGNTTVSGAMGAFGIGRNVVLKGLRLDGGGALTIDLDCYLSDMVIEDCEFRGATSAGVNCHDGGVPLIRRNLFTGNRRGIRCTNAGPLVVSNTFIANSSSHIANSGNPGPLVGGSPEAANDFSEHGTRAIANYDSVAVSAEYNYWGADCVLASWFTGPVDYMPWTDAAHEQTFHECWAGVPEGAVPTATYLRPGTPNPMSRGTSIAFGLAEPLDAVTLRIYDVSGRAVRTLLDGPVPAGHHVASWDGRDNRGDDVASGVYLYRLEAGASSLVGKVAVLR